MEIVVGVTPDINALAVYFFKKETEAYMRARATLGKQETLRALIRFLIPPDSAISGSSNFVMNELPARLARHPRLVDNPELALQETFEQVDRALVSAATEDEQIFR